MALLPNHHLDRVMPTYLARVHVQSLPEVVDAVRHPCLPGAMLRGTLDLCRQLVHLLPITRG